MCSCHLLNSKQSSDIEANGNNNNNKTVDLSGNKFVVVVSSSSQRATTEKRNCCGPEVGPADNNRTELDGKSGFENNRSFCCSETAQNGNNLKSTKIALDNLNNNNNNNKTVKDNQIFGKFSHCGLILFCFVLFIQQHQQQQRKESLKVEM